MSNESKDFVFHSYNIDFWNRETALNDFSNKTCIEKSRIHAFYDRGEWHLQARKIPDDHGIPNQYNGF